ASRPQIASAPPAPAPAPVRVKPTPALPKIELLAKSEPVAALPPQRPPAPVVRSQPAPTGTSTVAGRYALQENANALRDYYRSQNIRVAVEPINVNGRPMYQVRVWR
ncbi:MAG TPA: hypothetical protein PLP22_15215, partial [Candidatus Competibacter sp.]|nr:hypothetical protein [Candidatus Competibacter sp.]